jgi:hypothetical protein
VSKKSEILIEIMALEKALRVVPHGSRHVGGWTEDSDYDYFCDAYENNIKWLKEGGYTVQFTTGYFDDNEPIEQPSEDVSLVAYRHPTLPIQVCVMSHEYYPIYYAANEMVKSMEGAKILETREGRVTTYKHVIARARELAAKDESSQAFTGEVSHAD